MRINLFDILSCLSGAVDLSAPELTNHHHQVAYLAYRLAEQLNYTKQQQRDILIEGMVHDLGALSVKERLAILENEPITVNSHAFRSAKLLEKFAPFSELAEAVRYHHVPWEGGKGKVFDGRHVPSASHLIHLADRTCVMINRSSDVLSQIPAIIVQIQAKSNDIFVPEFVDALVELSAKEYIWLDLTDKYPLDCLPDILELGIMNLELDDVICIADIFSHIIDFRSHFTATHSAGVAKIAERLGELSAFSQNECKMVMIAGYLHDLGKIAIEDSVLEKPEKLDEQEYNSMRSHTYYTYRLLSSIKGFEIINKWASFHHEKINGNGYPFHLNGDNLPLGSKIVAVADIFTAITEHRAYRKDMGKDQIILTLNALAENGSICPKVVSDLLNNFDMMTELCHTSQQQASDEYEQFLSC